MAERINQTDQADQRIFPASFPGTRLRRIRQHAWLRSIVAETVLSPTDLIWPLFVHDHHANAPIAAMPGVERLSIEGVLRAVEEAQQLSIPAVALFPVVEASLKSDDAQHALEPQNLVCRTIRAIRESCGNSVGIICDVALDPYTSHGHDGLLDKGQILNDETVAVLARQAVILATAGCDVVAPSDMMDGRVAAIRRALDTALQQNVCILSYAAKYASSLYGPFRMALGSATSLGTADKKTYQMDSANSDEAIREVSLDLAEGADMVMVKPAIVSLDILYRIKQMFGVPTMAYQVSGEYSMIQAAAANGWIDGPKASLESLLVMKRAGADAILTYFAPEIARLLK
ncbi:MAG: porphobilinogen synthase [Planctomycetia bacterium]|nr:porphobilinogen synthase [Planctomycetia bacterium]